MFAFASGPESPLLTGYFPIASKSVFTSGWGFSLNQNEDLDLNPLASSSIPTLLVVVPGLTALSGVLGRSRGCDPRWADSPGRGNCDVSALRVIVGNFKGRLWNLSNNRAHLY